MLNLYKVHLRANNSEDRSISQRSIFIFIFTRDCWRLKSDSIKVYCQAVATYTLSATIIRRIVAIKTRAKDCGSCRFTTPFETVWVDVITEAHS